MSTEADSARRSRWMRPTAVAGLLVLNIALFAFGLRSTAADPVAGPGSPAWLVVAGSGLPTGLAAANGALPGGAVVVARPGASLLSDDGKTAGELILEIRRRQDLGTFEHVVIQAGESDVDAPDESLRIAVAHLIDYLRAQVPAATSLTLVGPVPDDEPVAEELLRLNESLRAEAVAHRVHYIDPISLDLDADDPRLEQKVAVAVATAAGAAERAPSSTASTAS